MRRRFVAMAVILAVGLALSAVPTATVTAETRLSNRYLVVFNGEFASDGSFALGGNYALNHQYALSLIQAAGGTVANDLSRQTGVIVVESSNALFAQLMGGNALVEVVG